MSKFTDKRNLQEITLPSYPEDKVSMYTSLLTEDYEKIMEEQVEFKRTLKMLVALIKSWTFTLEDDKQMEVNETNLKKLPTPDFTFLVEKMTNILDETTEKKMKK